MTPFNLKWAVISCLVAAAISTPVSAIAPITFKAERKKTSVTNTIESAPLETTAQHPETPPPTDIAEFDIQTNPLITTSPTTSIEVKDQIILPETPPSVPNEIKFSDAPKAPVTNEISSSVPARSIDTPVKIPEQDIEFIPPLPSLPEETAPPVIETPSAEIL